MGSLDDVFQTGDSKRDNFLSRVFGIFNEEVVKHWCASPNSPYIDLGRPTLFTAQGTWHTLDFTLQHQDTGRTFVTEMKCELAYDAHRYLRLRNAGQLDHHTGTAFVRFLEFAASPEEFTVKVGGKPVRADGALLVWGATTPEGVASLQQATSIEDVLAVESMLDDLRAWQDSAWRTRTEELRSWCSALFDFIQ